MISCKQEGNTVPCQIIGIIIFHHKKKTDHLKTIPFLKIDKKISNY